MVTKTKKNYVGDFIRTKQQGYKGRQVLDKQSSNKLPLEKRVPRKFGGYELQINSGDCGKYCKKFGSETGAMEVVIKTIDGDKFWSVFIPLKGLDQIMKNYKKTGECDSGSYFAMRPLVVTKELMKDEKKTYQLVKKQINHMAFKDYDIYKYFEKI